MEKEKQKLSGSEANSIIDLISIFRHKFLHFCLEAERAFTGRGQKKNHRTDGQSAIFFFPSFENTQDIFSPTRTKVINFIWHRFVFFLHHHLHTAYVCKYEHVRFDQNPAAASLKIVCTKSVCDEIAKDRLLFVFPFVFPVRVSNDMMKEVEVSGEKNILRIKEATHETRTLFSVYFRCEKMKKNLLLYNLELRSFKDEKESLLAAVIFFIFIIIVIFFPSACSYRLMLGAAAAASLQQGAVFSSSHPLFTMMKFVI